MAQPNQPTPERAAQGAGKSIPIEDDRPADAKAQPQARPAAAEAAPQGEAIEAEVIEDAGPSADEQVAQAKAEAQDWQDKYLRLHAEWDTYRRRTAEQREAVGIDKEVVVVGNTGYFEIWDAKRYDAVDDETDLGLLFD